MGKASDNISIQEAFYAWAYNRISVLFPLFFKSFFSIAQGKGWSGGAMVLGKLSAPGRPTNLNYSRARAYCAYSRCGRGLFGHFFSRLSFLLFLPLSGRRSDID